MVNRYKTRNLKSLFPLKDKDLHFACKIYKGICSCEPTYVGDVEIIYLEHNHPSGKSEPSKHLHFACKIYKVICSCEPTYVGETKRNVEVIYLEHNHPSGKSEPSKHLHQNINHVVTWSVICSAPKIDRTRI